MQIVVLMAGEGKRFTDAGITTPKPFIFVNDKPIVEWTTRSLPFIVHHGKFGQTLPDGYTITFAMRREHERYVSVLKSIYGEHIQTVFFDKTTKGNLATAYKVTKDIPHSKQGESLLILDSDNHYDGSEFIHSIINQSNDGLSATICYFDPLDKSTKWCFAFPEENTTRIKALVEKDPRGVYDGGKPMVGTFFFRNVSMFNEFALHALIREQEGEYYMSQVPKKMIDFGISVYGHKVTSVAPLGTPEDVEMYKDRLR